MPAKEFTVADIGQVWLTKRKGSRSIRISLKPDGRVVVNTPWWVTQSQAITYVESKRDWITKNRVATEPLLHNQQIGKAHRLEFIESDSIRPSSRVVDNVIKVFVPPGQALQPQVQKVAKAASKRALILEAENLLPQRLEQVSLRHNIPYRSVSIKHHKTRWGVCDARKNIVLNCFLMQVPWSLIDYVIVHELAHTKVMSHSQEFWESVEQMLPNYKILKKQLKDHKTSF